MPETLATIACSCAAAQFKATQPPLMRALCHCMICQRFNQAEFADVAVYRAKDVQVLDDGTVAYTAHKNPPLVQRGTCLKCNRPAVEKVSIPLVPRLTIVPVANIADSAELPDPALHIFYDMRVRDAVDDVPRHSGYMRSQLAFSAALLRGMLTRQR